MARPDPCAELRITALLTLRGANYWSVRPVSRMDMAVGAYDEISSADAPGAARLLVDAMPTLREHGCSRGAPGGFLERLREGTYAPHITEHVALELQRRAGHDVSYGKTRGGDRPGEYTLAVEHRHAAVGVRALALALHVVQRAFAGTLEEVEHEVAELQALAATPDATHPGRRIACAVAGSGARRETRLALLSRGVRDHEVVELAPAYLLWAGLPYAGSAAGIILDSEPDGVPERYRDSARAATLLSVVADGVERGGTVVIPAGAPRLRERVLRTARSVACFSPSGRVPVRDARAARAVAVAERGRVVIDEEGTMRDEGQLDARWPVAAQLAAALAARALAARTLERATTVREDARADVEAAGQ